jgi:hypothetical protein
VLPPRRKTVRAPACPVPGPALPSSEAAHGKHCVQWGRRPHEARVRDSRTAGMRVSAAPARHAAVLANLRGLEVVPIRGRRRDRATVFMDIMVYGPRSPFLRVRSPP